MSGREAVNAVIGFGVDAHSTSTDLERLTVGLPQPDGSLRMWHGLCTAASWLEADGGIARYRLRLEAALAMLALRRDSYIFQDMNVRNIVCELLADYPQPGDTISRGVRSSKHLRTAIRAVEELPA